MMTLLPGGRPDIKMNDREKEIVLMLAEGYLHTEIAEKMYLNLSTTNASIKKLKLMTLSKTDAQLIAELYHRGYLKPSKDHVARIL
jgi:DNA-binding CsgD family transcriptional regulator